MITPILENIKNSLNSSGCGLQALSRVYQEASCLGLGVCCPRRQSCQDSKFIVEEAALQVGVESPQPKRVSEMGFLACILEWSDGPLYSHHPHPHHLSSMKSTEWEKGGQFSFCSFSQNHSLRCIFESKEFIWEAVPGKTSLGSGKVGQEREGRRGRMCYQGHIQMDSLNIIPPGNSRKRPHFETSQKHLGQQIHLLLPPRIFPTQGLNPHLSYLRLAGGFFTTSATREAPLSVWGLPTTQQGVSPHNHGQT